jgi:hypothetical protein
MRKTVRQWLFEIAVAVENWLASSPAEQLA